jgi:hypothetical protein
MKSIAKEIEALRAMTVPELVERYRQVYGKTPRVKHKEYLWKRISWKIQEIRFGGLSRAAKRRLNELIAEIDLPIDENQRTVTGKIKSTRKPQCLQPGTVLSRQWHGQEIRVIVRDNGFEWNADIYRSLSGVAKAATGSHWNGNLFFGLSSRKKR